MSDIQIVPSWWLVSLYGIGGLMALLIFFYLCGKAIDWLERIFFDEE